MSKNINNYKLIYSEGAQQPQPLSDNIPNGNNNSNISCKNNRTIKISEQIKTNLDQISTNNNNNSDTTNIFGIKTDKPSPPSGVTKVLLHSCCAPCSGAMVEEMRTHPAIQKVVVFFYNPNIHPRAEYEIRKNENKAYCNRIGVDFIDCDYDVDNWYQRMKGMEFDPERGRRCSECFDMRMERTALYAHEHGFHAIATTNSTSRWKDSNQVDESGFKAVSKYDGVQYWKYNWQSDEMTIRKYQISANERFYKQEYCGCSFSLRDSNEWRKANGIPKIEIGGDKAGIGNRYFSDVILDSAEESQEVVDEFFAQAENLAKVGRDVKERKSMLKVYENRRKSEAIDGTTTGLNNW